MKEKLLLLHGALGSKKQFSVLKERLSASYDVYALDFEGHGGHVSQNKFSIQLFAENVLSYLQEKSIEEITIFGYSMGGYVALSAALQGPEKVKKVITLGTKFKWDLVSAAKETQLLNPTKIEEKVPAFAEKLKLEHDPQDWKEVMDKTAQMMIHMAEGAKMFDSDFKKITQSVSIGVGSLDHMVSYEESEHVSNLIPNAKLIQLEGVKHAIDTIGPDILIHYIKNHCLK